MSSTRRVQPGARRAQNGWASALEFDELRGLNGSAVAFKAALLTEPKKQQLLYFLQALSLREGGIKRIAREVLEMFPERIGTPTMVKIGCRSGKRLTQDERDKIDGELHGDTTSWDLAGLEDDAPHEKHCQTADFPWSHRKLMEDDAPLAPHEKRGERMSAELWRSVLMLKDAAPPEKHCQSTAADFCKECRSLAEMKLDQFIVRLCCDPKLAVTNDRSEMLLHWEIVQIAMEDADVDEQLRGDLEAARLHYFQDALGALFEYKRRHEQQVREEFVETSIGRVVFEALDYALETGRSALVEGESGIGKTTAIKAWCELHLSQARHVQLNGITHRTGFFCEVASALGIARGGGFSASKVQVRVERFLQRTKMMLIIDEGQYLFPSGNRVAKPPELINWLDTACYNKGIPFVISATSEFRARRAIVEKNTTWNSEQLRRRIRRQFTLPPVPTKEDLHRVACKLLPDLGRDEIEYVVGYSMVSKGFFQAITNSIEDARLIASRGGRAEIKFSDLKAAIQDWRSPSDAALQRVFENQPKGRRGRASEAEVQPESVPVFPPVEEPLTRLSRPVNSADRQEISPVPD